VAGLVGEEEEGVRAFNDLLKRTKRLLSDWDGLSERYRAELEKAARECEDARASQQEIEAARQLHCVGSDDNVEIDDALCSHGENGFWVQGWLWVPQAPGTGENTDDS